MKKLFAIFLSICFLGCATEASALRIKGESIDFSTEKVAKIIGYYSKYQAYSFKLQMARTEHLPGNRLIIINSPGGEVDAGKQIIAAMLMEQARGIKMICVVEGEAASMAFNTFSFCDERYAIKNSSFLAHKIRTIFPDERPRTAKDLREEAKNLDRADEPWCAKNAYEMHLSRPQYDIYADQEHEWSCEDLIKLKYLKEVVTVTNE